MAVNDKTLVMVELFPRMCLVEFAYNGMSMNDSRRFTLFIFYYDLRLLFGYCFVNVCGLNITAWHIYHICPFKEHTGWW